MQSILSIDLSCSPAAAVVVQVNGREASVQEIHRFDPGELLRTNGSNGTAPVETNGHAAHANELRDVLGAIRTPWTSSILLVPPQDYHSLNIDLPFSGTKGMDKIVELEVQDLVPFDLSEFLLHYAALGTRPDKQHDIHVGILPRATISHTLGACKQLGFEPAIVSTPANVLGALPFLGAESLNGPCAVISVRDTFVSLAILIDGRSCMDRVIDRRAVGGEGFGALAREIRLSIAAAETRYNVKVERLYTIGLERIDDLAASLDIPVSAVPLSDLVKAADATTALACLASVFAQDFRAPAISANFRVREFAYSPQLRELKRGLRALVPYLLACLLVAVITGAGIYMLRERRISNLKNAIQSQIRAAIPGLESPPGIEVDALEGENRKLEQQLKNLGSLSALSPLDSLRAISEDLPQTSGITVTRVRIEGATMRVEGTAPDYAALEKLERVLKRKRSVYCRVNKDITASVPGKPNVRGFRLDIILCE
jgi:Tfp pilus assembly protein PilN